MADAAAIRLFSKMCTDPQSTFNIQPADFTLYRVGTWDDETGQLEFAIHTNLGNGKPLAQKYEKAANE